MAAPADDDVDDYMTMTFGEEEAKPAKETSLQRRLRLEREGRERGRIPSKAELAKAAEAEREAALSRSLFDVPPRRSSSASASASAAIYGTGSAAKKPVNKGLAMMTRMGFVAGQALGKRRAESETKGERAASGENGQGQADDDASDTNDRPATEPIRIQVKRDRAGIGALDNEKDDTGDGKGGAAAGPDAKRAKKAETVDPLAYRDRIRQERAASRLERLVHAAQVVAERMAEGDDGVTDQAKAEGDGGETDLKKANVLWRGLVKERWAAEREKKLRQAERRRLDQSLRGRKFGVHDEVGGSYYDEDNDDDEDEDEDEDDRMAAGKQPKASFLGGGQKRTATSGTGRGDAEEHSDDSDDDDEDKDDELEAFQALPPQDRLQQIVDWLRQNRHYCFWCKYTYPDADMEGCPGPTEEDHD
ncbi:hypothetical protein SPI_03835 [Niveomyces insectorum RCEF 264]|uniref:DUF4187 domain-containing protein n=1 Tax=Niveomyces insectorum RCEF 264 TaxID=1081102 RepID=A0A162J4P7_9HYPO|nr:hypothetical protein SPI_03835 [Niveomyces insectorum RCEF 264]